MTHFLSPFPDLLCSDARSPEEHVRRRDGFQVVVFDNKNTPGEDPTERTVDCSNEDESGAAFLIRILQFLETPQYLRKALFPKHNSLRYAGLMPPLDAPHHLRRHEWALYREGVTLKAKAPNSSQTLVDVGLNKEKRVQDLFNRYLNTCPHQGSRTIRTEEAILISLQYFQEPISRALEAEQLN